MSTLARDKLKLIHYVRIPEQCIVFPMFNQQINVDRMPTHIINEIKQKLLNMEQSPLKFEIVFTITNKKEYNSCTFLVGGKLCINEKTNRCDYKIQVSII